MPHPRDEVRATVERYVEVRKVPDVAMSPKHLNRDFSRPDA